MKDKELQQKLEETIESLNSTVISLESRIKKVVTFNLNKLGKIEEKTNEAINKLSKKVTNINKSEKNIKQALLTQLQAFKSIEETFYTLYHNIKQNQFLFATSPKTFEEDHIDLKNKYEEENKDFIAKSKEIDESFFSNIFYQSLAAVIDIEDSLVD